ncbi:MFS domain-containing protein [Fusarium keratoplasticum]|uniref:MFS domain-containing protein n=1 Tax=Fusarium keratoplasticum TaxID=1328300 RepID=A0ACC0RBN6_9HYPO|nr:MFS domain-containing protein [Fusarium keratoplasticum]KAI8683371.1 MFS domain-containing protein [Fusarium keratoplasticum]
MTFGILKIAADQPSPPSTSLLKNLSANTQDAEVFLVPQPSASPADPLNMSRIRKELYFAALIYGACVTGVVGPVLVPGFSIVAAAFQINLTQVTLLNGSLVMALGVSAYVCGPLTTLWGRRLVFLFTTLIMVFGARIFQGLGMGTFFSVAGTASINDAFFIHQRGSRAGFWNFAVIVSVNASPVISGYVINGLSWQWSFRLLAISFALAFVCFSFFLMPETLFDRDSVVAGVEPSISVSDHLEAKSSASPALGAPDSVNDASSVGPPDKPALWKQTLGLKNVQMQPITQLIPILLRPPGLPRHPAIIWACAMWSVTYSWVIIQDAVADQIFTAPPYNLSPTSVGLLIGIAPLVGSAIGTILGGWMCDWMARLMVKQNGGVYEPGFRLVVFVPTLITIFIGSFGLVMAITNGLSIWACAVFLGFLNFGVGVGCTGIVAYSNDICQHRAADAFSVTMLVKSAFAFGLTSHEVH